MHFSAEVSETFRHWCRSVHGHFGTKHKQQRINLRLFGTIHMVPKCLGSEVSVHRPNVAPTASAAAWPTLTQPCYYEAVKKAYTKRALNQCVDIF